MQYLRHVSDVHRHHGRPAALLRRFRARRQQRARPAHPRPVEWRFEKHERGAEGQVLVEGEGESVRHPRQRRKRRRTVLRLHDADVADEAVMAVRDPADEAVNVEEADADQESVVAAGCAGVWEVGQGAGEVVVVGSLNGLDGRLDGVLRPILSDDDPLACLPDALCDDVPELDVLCSGPDERRAADVVGLW